MSSRAIVEIVFWVAAGLIFYIYIGYPMLLWIAQLFFAAGPRKAPIIESVSLLISAYNEADVIAAKIRNTLALDYPADKLEIVVASDGSTDETARIVRSFVAGEGEKQVHLVEFPNNRGKLSALNDTVPKLGGDIVVFSDANSMLAPDALRHLISNFADPRIGAVSGVYRVVNHEHARLGSAEDLYWKYETFLKTQEARLGVLTGAHGSFYAIRKNLYPFPPSGTVNDDFVIPTSVLRQGFRIGYETRAVSYEEAIEMEGFARRVRLAAGNFGQVRPTISALWPSQPEALFCFLSHKGGRLLVPFALIAMAASSALLWRSPFYRWALLVQAAFYLLAVVGSLVNLRPKALRLPLYFCKINVAILVWLCQSAFQRPANDSERGSRRQVEWG